MNVRIEIVLIVEILLDFGFNFSKPFDFQH